MTQKTMIDDLENLETTHDKQAALYEKILLGKIAAGQKLHKLALEYYISALKIKVDVALAREALNLSEKLKDQQSSLIIANLWVMENSDALIPWKLITYYLIKTQKSESLKEQAQIALERVIVLENNIDKLFTFLNRLVYARNLKQLKLLFQSFSEKYPGNPAITLAIAKIYAQEKNWSEAIALTSQLVKLNPDFKLAWKLKGTLLVASGEKNKALHWYKLTVQQFPKAANIRHTLGQLLYELDYYPEAREQFELILKSNPKDHDSRYMIAAIYFAEDNFVKSRQHFEPLLRFRRLRNPVLFYLGEIARNEKDIKAAINLYRQVTNSRYYTMAHITVARLMQQQENTLQAIEYLKGLDPALDDLEFRYMRALVAADLGDLGLTEADLRYILAINPDHHDALNALGYTLADANKNLPEALNMIERAYKNNPDSAAVLDSMGWVLYRLGKFKDALSYQQKAYDIEKSDEIAAHLSEILWTLNRKQQARNILKSAIIKSPTSKAVLEMLEKYKIDHQIIVEDS